MFSTLYRILLADSNEHTLEKMFAKVKQTLSPWGLEITSENIQKGDSINYSAYKILLQKFEP